MTNKLPFEKIERKILVKKESETDPKLGCKPEERKTEDIIKFGVVNIDKPKGPTSHQVSDFVQKILKINKSGHSGTLDPAVTGVLPISLGRATKVVQVLLNAGKEYVAIMHLHKEVEKEKILKVFKDFTGKIKQVPPVRSAVRRVKREREIYYLELIEIKEKDVLFKVGCEAGTYIRKLIFDMGRRLKVGAHMSELRRTKAGPFTEETIYTLQDLQDAFHYFNDGKDKYLKKIIQPVENATSHLPKIWINDKAVDSLSHGIDLKVPGIVKLNDKIMKEDIVAIMTLKDELVAIGSAKLTSENIMEKEKGLAVKTDKVFIEIGPYSTESIK